MMHPKVAYRDCDHCRAWQYDEATGNVEDGRDNNPLPRRGKVPCDASIGCAKGHWSAPKGRKLTKSEEWAIALYHSAKATGGAILSQDERNCEILTLLFSYLERMHQAKNTSEMASMMTSAMVRLKGL